MSNEENEILRAALEYIEYRWRVVPVHRPDNEGNCSCDNPSCSAVGKHPSISKWQEKASAEPAQIREWFSNGIRNIGIATGVNSGIFVLDIDGRHEGFESLRLMENRYGALPPTLTVKTPGGGEHRYFSCAEGLKNKVELADFSGIDIRAENGFVVAPPSLHKSGGHYEFVNKKEKVASAPDWLLKLIKGEGRSQKKKEAKTDSGVIDEGSRNDALFKFGCRLHRLGLSADDILSVLYIKNQSECRPPLEDSELEQIVESISKYPTEGDDASSGSNWGYEIRNGQVVQVSFDSKGREKVKIVSDFWAKIVSELIRDNGNTTNIRLLVEGFHKNGTRFPAVTIDAEEFLIGQWPLLRWGTLANIGAGQGQRDHFRAAIQALSQDRKVERTYTHAGWRRIDDRYLFLHAAGAIGADGVRTDVLVDLTDGSLTDVTLPLPVSREALCSAVRKSFRIFDLVPARIAYPLYMGMPRAILGDLMDANFSFFLEGPTGIGKSAVAGVYQAFFGEKFNGSNLPMNFTSTVNYNEAKLFHAKNLVIVIDDYVPGETLEAHINRMLRNQGNRAGRGRMQADSRLRPTFYSRALLILTGEATPRGGSILARLLIISILAGEVNFDVLTELQIAASQGILAQVTSAFIQWVAPQMDSLKDEFLKTHADLRQQASQSRMHKRTPDIMAQLGASWKIFLRFAEEKAAITTEERQKLWSDGWLALGETASQQIAFQANENMALRFIDLISAAFVMGKVHITDAKKDVAPVDAQLLGWEKGTSSFGDSWQPRGSKIGWYHPEDKEIWLLPDAAFAAAQEIARLQGAQLPVTSSVVWKRLAQEGLIITQKDKNLNRRTISGGTRPMVVVFPARIFLDKTLAPVATETPAFSAAGAGGKLANFLDHREKQKRRSELDAMENPRPEDEVKS